MATLKEIRAKLLAAENKESGNGGGDGSIFQFWNMDENGTSTIRFLPDGDENNTFFWVEKQMIRLPFEGIEGEADSKRTTVTVPCMEMYGEKCPILTEIRPWFKDPSLEELGRAYWKKRTYLFHGFVRDNNLEGDNEPATKLRKFNIGPQLFNTIKAALLDPDMEHIPTDFVNGVDFRLTKTAKGEYADYSTSNWARKESSLTQEEIAAIEEQALPNLSDGIPKMPNDDDLRVIKEMFEASVEGEKYDPVKWGNYYKPYGYELSRDVQNQANATSSTSSAPSNTVSVSETSVSDTTGGETSGQASSDNTSELVQERSAQDILAAIRNNR